MSDQALTVQFVVDVGDTWVDPAGDIWRVTGIKPAPMSAPGSVVELERPLRTSADALELVRAWRKAEA